LKSADATSLTSANVSYDVTGAKLSAALAGDADQKPNAATAIMELINTSGLGPATAMRTTLAWHRRPQVATGQCFGMGRPLRSRVELC
jgi:hypothetical protein